ncbi:hypothetical protein DL764_003005 [Monosporascus ibericus]|uniref:DDHD domain-containing protein n=1 Tax=Monosporascus ibericus TaxID=155417 RepID=A0A4Q4TMZ3_9PEZI|nr:hypothetical protein DL764_003005 [Monosporascus ibericus]
MNYYGDIPKSHNFGPECRLAPVTQPFPLSEVDDIPPINAQYFYNSPIPIDDPLSASAITATTTDSKASKGNLQPFSRGDNNALERAWLGLASAQRRRNHVQARRSRCPSPSLARANADKLTAIVHDLAVKHAEKHAREGPSRETMQPVIDPVDPVSAPGTTVTLCCRDLLSDVGIALRTSFCAVARRHQKALDREKVAQDVMAEMATPQEKQIDATDSPRTLLPQSEKEQYHNSVDVPVGVSRLHKVSLPALQMKPIYWSPVNDIATVLRATWFYRDDMRPLDPVVANQLEAGYRELKPHTETWADELRSAIEVGPLGEEKVSHPLWPTEPKSSARQRLQGEDAEPPISSNPFCAARCFRGEAAAEGSLLPTSNEDNTAPAPAQKKFEQYHVIYKDSTTAFLLKPSLKPSAYYGRRPVAKIAKGFTIGIPVVRGFDYETWMKKHRKKQTQQQYSQRYGLAGENDSQRPGQGVCAACKAEKECGQVSDLVLVVHGIGQKLAERVETYHFTHAINAFRRAINVELRNEAVRAVLRDGQNGIMVLPVNWRQNLSFEEGGPTKEEDKDTYNPQGFGLRDIEPKTIPAIRSMISDVMFDIPFYMSHHKPKMVAAVLENPMQLEHFEFDTKNLFLLGSPAAFFLLLERGALMPRRGRKKPGADPADTVSAGVVGNAGSFGCVAVDNIYNVLAREDAVAYFLNGTVDPTYAASLKTAYVPSTTTSLLQSMGNAVMSMVPGVSSSNASANPGISRPPTVRLPSQLELEVHDFTREEIAEKKAYLLNDNGQIDYFLRSGGGPLELQYLNMLSAHSSYWVNHDLIRMLCMEIGRKPGKANTLPAMRAVKATKRIVSSTS